MRPNLSLVVAVLAVAILMASTALVFLMVITSLATSGEPVEIMTMSPTILSTLVCS